MNPIIIKHTWKDFAECLEIINKVWAIAESHNHHPDIKLHSYKHIEFTLITHDEWKVTEKDKKLSEAIKSILSQYQ